MIPWDIFQALATMAGDCRAISKRSGRSLSREDPEKTLPECRTRDSSAHGSLPERDWRSSTAATNDQATAPGDRDSEATTAVLVDTRADHGDQNLSSAMLHTGSDVGARLAMYTTIIPTPAYPFFGKESRSDNGVPAVGRPDNFGVVVPGVYRSSYPQTRDYVFIKDLELRTIV